MTEKHTRRDSEVSVGDDASEARRSTPTDSLVQLLLEKAEIFHDPDRVAYARYEAGDHREVYPVNSLEFRNWVGATYFKKYEAAVSPRALEIAISTITAHAVHGSRLRNVHLRTALHNGKYYIDLADKRWRVVEIDATGWRVLDKSPVLFTRKPAMRALPTPKKGGKFKSILKIANLSENDWVLVLTWLIECLRPETPYPGLALIGPQGSAKSMTQSIFRSLVDPSRENLRVKPRNVSDLYVAAGNSHLLSYENLSEISADMQDAMCSILTGGGFASRRLFSNEQEHLIALKRPIAVNGISQVITRPDLLDRFIVLQLPPISDRRLAATEIEERFGEQKSQLFGAMLFRFSQALALLPTVKEQNLPLPRMADFALLGEAVSQSLKCQKGWFLKRFAAIQRRNVEHAVEESPVGAAIRSSLSKPGQEIKGLYVEVSEKLRKHWLGMPQSRSSSAPWPSTGKALGDELRRLQGSMPLLGITIELGRRTSDGYVCLIRRAGAIRKSAAHSAAHGARPSTRSVAAQPRSVK